MDNNFLENERRNHKMNTTNKSPRLFSIDALRGTIIVLMGLDHANHFLSSQYSAEEYWGGTSLPVYDDPLVFLTRFVTHLAAPGFFFLMGAGMILFTDSHQKKGWKRREIVSHFIIRGGLFIILQLLVVNRVWFSQITFIYFGVLFALGGAMVIGSLFLWVKPKSLGFITVALVLGMAYQISTLVGSDWNSLSWDLPNLILLYPGGPANGNVWSNYPILPWLGLTLFGIVFGKWIIENSKKAFNRILKLGISLLAIFIVIQLMNWKHFDITFFSIRKVSITDWIDFLSVVKYPPSILFILLTMGFLLIIMGLVAKCNNRVKQIFQPLVVFGRVPLFFYVTHLFLYKGMSFLLQHKETSLLPIYLYWLIGLVILYPFCLMYGHLKRRYPANPILRLL